MSTNETTLLSLAPEIEIVFGSCIIDEQFPHVAENLILFWGEPEFYEQTDRLMSYSYDHNRSHRQGFPFRAIQELEIAVRVHHRCFPDVPSLFNDRDNDPWSV
jgi:hypothetical protein